MPIFRPLNSEGWPIVFTEYPKISVCDG